MLEVCLSVDACLGGLHKVFFFVRAGLCFLVILSDERFELLSLI